MYIFSNIVYRRISASLLLALLIFIYVEKVFHTHTNIVNSKAIAVTTISNNAGCDICDFTIAKDAEIPVSEDLDYTSSPLSKNYIPVSSSACDESSHFISGRGPPSL